MMALRPCSASQLVSERKRRSCCGWYSRVSPGGSHPRQVLKVEERDHDVGDRGAPGRPVVPLVVGEVAAGTERAQVALTDVIRRVIQMRGPEDDQGRADPADAPSPFAVPVATPPVDPLQMRVLPPALAEALAPATGADRLDPVRNLVELRRVAMQLVGADRHDAVLPEPGAVAGPPRSMHRDTDKNAPARGTRMADVCCVPAR